ncbi:MAG: ATP-dependent DNA helicase RecG [Gemmatimonadetes bacterium]|nr:ATP-dependent DNA helicase RecG [Gemmatimonadota bacterium]
MTSLDRPVQFLKGVGPRRAESLQRIGILTARDLLYHVPRRYDDASTITPVALAEVGMDVTVAGEVRSKGIVPTRSGLRIFQAVIKDDSGLITCAWPGQPWVERLLREGDRILVTGKVKFFHGRQIQPREHTILSRAGGDSPPTPSGTIFATYPAAEDLPQWILRRLFVLNLDSLIGQVARDEYLTPPERQALNLIELSAALRDLHRPPSLDRVDAARRRLAWDELFLLQLMQARVRHQATLERPGIAFVRTNELIRALHDSLPFRLTAAQARVLRDITADMTSPRRMNRLLQGDVGCGKTVVALFAMLLAVEGGFQAALMAPTEILAEQHAGAIRALLGGLPVGVEVLRGSVTGRRRDEARARVAGGEARLVVGSHALIQEGVEFEALGLVVVDEQHRFGVRQRMALAERDPRPDTLLMSATPIPRSLAMTLHGELDLSIIDELPPGRRPVATRAATPGQRGKVLGEVCRHLDRGRQAYLVYPAIEESERADLLAAEAEFERLGAEELAGRTLALLHGRMPADEKDRIMRDFQAGRIEVLVATTVVEVGIDVPNATVMVVENAERFGLSQLHQLRGRVGRGVEGGLCVAITGEPESERVAAFVRTTDGFEIASEDLRIRGQGDFFGAEQHGHSTELRFADLFKHEDLIRPARERARALIDVDPRLADPANAPVRAHLDRRYGERAKLFGVG